MKRIFLFVFLTGLSFCHTNAQTYKALWKTTETQIARDLPQSALTTTYKILQKARREGNEGQMLEALLCRLTLQADVAPDSAKAEAARLKHLLRTPSSPALRALVHLALAELYQTYAFEGDEWPDSCLQHTQAALAAPAMLHAARVEAYRPALVEGHDGQITQHDLLFPLSRQAFSLLSRINYPEALRDSAQALLSNKQAEVLNLYRGEKNGNAVILLTLDSLDREPQPELQAHNYRDHAQFRLLQTLADTYGTSLLAPKVYERLCTLTHRSGMQAICLDIAQQGLARYPHNAFANSLRQTADALVQPYVSAEWPNKFVIPGNKITLNLSARHMRGAQILVYRTALKASSPDFRRFVTTPSVAARYAKHPVLTLNKEFPPHEAYQEFTDSLSFRLQQAGIYLLCLRADGLEPQYAWMSVSNNLISSLSLPGGRTRYLVTDATTGAPLAQATVERISDQGRLLTTYTTDSAGCFTLPTTRRPQSVASQLFVSARGDAYCPGYNDPWNTYHAPSGRTLHNEALLYTDRAIYRPGQMVQVSAVLFNRLGDETHTLSGERCLFRLFDANHREIAHLDTVTDLYGAAAAQFKLPADGLTGQFRVAVGSLASKYFRVEQYKRPTFTVSMDTVRSAYAVGDTVRVGGTARSYSGVAMSGARVTYRVVRTRGWWVQGRQTTTLLCDTLFCDENGRFEVVMPLAADVKQGVQARQPAWHRFVAYIDVLSPDGETQSTEMALSIGHERLRLSSNWPEQMLKTALPHPIFALHNANGAEVSAQGILTLTHAGRQVTSRPFHSGRAIDMNELSAWPSGSYSFTAVCGGDTLTGNFCLFGLADTRPADRTAALWAVADATEFQADGTAHLQVGSPLQGATLYYDLFAGDRLVESRRFMLSDSVVLLPLKYQEEWGDGVLACVALVRDGRLYTRNLSLSKPLPQKKLQMHWTSFRDALQPGQHESWRLKVTNPNGQAVDARVLAVLYDASLDQFGLNDWPASLSYNRRLPYARWLHVFGAGGALSSYAKLKSYVTPVLQFDGFGAYWPADYRYGRFRFGRSRLLNSTLSLDAVPMTQKAQASMHHLAAKEASFDEVRATGAMDVAAPEATPIDPSRLRTNFAETAFFMPNLVTNEKGEVVMEFTLPQSTTAWNFRAIAHTRTMEMGRLDATATARKTFMLTASLPRFLRAGDRASLTATLRNLSDERAQGVVRLEILNAENQTPLVQATQKFMVKAGGHQEISFALTVPSDVDMLLVRMLAEGEQFSDGEQHYLPVLATHSRVTQSLPFTLQGSGRHTISFGDSLFADPTARGALLSVEYTDDPAWLAVEALPQMVNVAYENALSLAQAYYASTLVAYLARTQPAIKTAAQAWAQAADADSLTANPLLRNEALRQTLTGETPWQPDARSETMRRHALVQLFDSTRVATHTQNLLERLRRLQQPDGAWCWFSGMRGSFYVTLCVTDWLERLFHLTATDMTSVTRPALAYLSRSVVQQVARMKQDEARGAHITLIGEEQLRYLDLVGRSSYQPKAEEREAISYLTHKLATTTAGYNLKEKALCALVLARSGWTNEARLALKSIMEHSVATPIMGRYFDSYRAPSSHDSYRIPTQVAVIEALHTLHPEQRQTLSELITWLVQSKRTQAWQNPLNAVDAVYALLCYGGKETSVVSLSAPSQPADLKLKLTDGKTLSPDDETMADKQTTGYRLQTYHMPQATGGKLIIDRTSTQMAWGAVYATCESDNRNVKWGGSELFVRCTYLRFKNGRWQPARTGENWQVGDRVRVRYDVEARRDFDFVALSDHRPANLEPLDPLSGYRWAPTQGYYRAVKDASIAYFFEHLPKGTHRVEEEFVVDRSGTYQSGLTTVECCYAPEFAGRDVCHTLQSR